MCAVSVAFFKVFGGHRSFCGVTDTPCFGVMVTSVLFCQRQGEPPSPCVHASLPMCKGFL